MPAILEEEMATETVEIPEFTDWVSGLARNFLECRTMGHRWTPRTATWDKFSQAYYVIHECDRCETERRAWWSKTGEILSSSYGYVKGYLARTGKDRTHVDGNGRQTLRAEYLTRVFKG